MQNFDLLLVLIRAFADLNKANFGPPAAGFMSQASPKYNSPTSCASPQTDYEEEIQMESDGADNEEFSTGFQEAFSKKLKKNVLFFFYHFLPKNVFF